MQALAANNAYPLAVRYGRPFEPPSDAVAFLVKEGTNGRAKTYKPYGFPIELPLDATEADLHEAVQGKSGMWLLKPINALGEELGRKSGTVRIDGTSQSDISAELLRHLITILDQNNETLRCTVEKQTEQIKVLVGSSAGVLHGGAEMVNSSSQLVRCAGNVDALERIEPHYKEMVETAREQAESESSKDTHWAQGLLETPVVKNAIGAIVGSHVARKQMAQQPPRQAPPEPEPPEDIVVGPEFLDEIKSHIMGDVKKTIRDEVVNAFREVLSAAQRDNSSTFVEESSSAVPIGEEDDDGSVVDDDHEPTESARVEVSGDESTEPTQVAVSDENAEPTQVEVSDENTEPTQVAVSGHECTDSAQVEVSGEPAQIEPRVRPPTSSDRPTTEPGESRVFILPAPDSPDPPIQT